MSKDSRVKKSLLNARINMVCYFVSIAIAFFTRKIFLDKFGAEFIGLTGTLQSLLGFLNLAELGVGTAIGYVLYKPIYDEDHTKINEIISVFGFLYRCIGLFIVGAGVILSLFLPLIFPDTPFSWGVIYFGFYAYLFSSMLGYFVNYKQVLLGADQRNYVVTGYFQLTTTVKTLVQMVQAMTITSFYLFLAIEILFGIVNSIILEWKINQTYPWLKSEIRLGRGLFKKYPEIGKYVKQLFIHKIGGFVQYQLSPLLIYSYVSLPIVALYGNYTLLTDRVRSFFNAFLGSTGAGIGSLISEGNQEKIYSVYKELLVFRVFLSGVAAISIYMLIQEFIRLWLGDDFLLPNIIPLIVCAQFFLLVVREVTDQFINGYGLFYDVWAPFVEILIFVISSIGFGSMYGLQGVVMGPIISTLIIVYLWKPYFLFSKGFRKSAFLFWFHLLTYILVLALASVCAIWLYSQVLEFIKIKDGWLAWLIHAALFTVINSIISFAFYFATIKEFRGFLARLNFYKKGNRQ
jgi:O-antigen/teichoic acid export membrane protein